MRMLGVRGVRGPQGCRVGTIGKIERAIGRREDCFVNRREVGWCVSTPLGPPTVAVRVSSHNPIC